MKPTLEIPNELEVVTQCKYSVPASGVPFFMVQSPTVGGSLFQFRKSKSFDKELDSEPVSTIMTIEEVEILIQLMKEQNEHNPCLMFTQHYLLTENEDEFILFFQLIQKYFYPICENWKSVHNMQRLQNKRKLAAESEPETESESESEAESTTDSNE